MYPRSRGFQSRCVLVFELLQDLTQRLKVDIDGGCVVQEAYLLFFRQRFRVGLRKNRCHGFGLLLEKLDGWRVGDFLPVIKVGITLDLGIRHPGERPGVARGAPGRLAG